MLVGSQYVVEPRHSLFRNLDVVRMLDFQRAPQVLQRGPTPFGIGMRDVDFVI